MVDPGSFPESEVCFTWEICLENLKWINNSKGLLYSFHDEHS